MKEMWREDEDVWQARKQTKEIFLGKVKEHTWNEGRDIPVVPVLFGADSTTAWTILRCGFSHFERDLGVYGAGMYHLPSSLPYLPIYVGVYFSQSVRYLAPHFAFRSDPAILISWAIPGNVSIKARGRSGD